MTTKYSFIYIRSRLLVYGNETTQAKFQEAVRLYRGIERFVEFRRLEPFETFVTEDGYEVTSLLADHNQPERSLMYLVRGDGRQILYAHDTGIFPESTWEFLEGIRLDLVSLDCTALSRDWRQGHMGFEAVDEVRDRLRRMGCIGGDTRLVLNHFAHFGDFTHEKICQLQNPKGYEVAYDGCVFEC